MKIHSVQIEDSRYYPKSWYPIPITNVHGEKNLRLAFIGNAQMVAQSAGIYSRGMVNISMVGMLVPGIGSIFHPPDGKDYKWYISGIFPANWEMDYATDPTFYGNQKQPLNIPFCSGEHEFGSWKCSN